MRFFSPKLCGIHFIAVALIAVCSYLSVWQWDRAHVQSHATISTQARPLIELSPLRDYLPVKSVGRKAVEYGSFINESQYVYWHRPIDGPDLLTATTVRPKSGWLVAIFGAKDGSQIGVVLGATTNRNLRIDLSGLTSVTGFLQPSEDSPNLGLATDFSRNKPQLTLGNLRALNKASGILHDGYLVLDATPSINLSTVTPIFSEPIHGGLHWRNVVYTFNWIFFALIITAMWWRIVRDEFQSTENYSSRAN